MAGKLGLNASWMHSHGADPAVTMTAVELDCEQDVRGL
jgi:hypothetical protein